MFVLSRNNKKIINKLIWITGTGRTGTTIGGKLISSFKNVEYFFEPNTIPSILPMINKVDFPLWKIIFETYLIEDLFFNSLAGRSLNFNKNDDSFIYTSYSKKEIKKRLILRTRRKNFFHKPQVQNKTILIKSLDSAKYLLKVQKKYPKIRFIFFKRNINSTLTSIIKKKWYYKNGYNSAHYPMVKKNNDYFPNWLDKKNYLSWLNFNQYEKCVFYILEMHKYEKQFKRKIIFNYDMLLKKPYSYTKKICKKLNMRFGPNTKKIIKTIKPKNNNLKINLNKWVRKELLQKLNKIS